MFSKNVSAQYHRHTVHRIKHLKSPIVTAFPPFGNLIQILNFFPEVVITQMLCIHHIFHHHPTYFLAFAFCYCQSVWCFALMQVVLFNHFGSYHTLPYFKCYHMLAYVKIFHSFSISSTLAIFFISSASANFTPNFKRSFKYRSSLNLSN